MKVFISHSSKDKWAARRIRDDLERLGCKTFLDERDIATGDTLDESIQSHLIECEDFLLLLSPASVQSEWVLIELGGALALKKRIVPILLYVSANEAPKAINLKLARDINEIDRYYAEVGVRSGAPAKSFPTPTHSHENCPPPSGFRKGTHVVIALERPPHHFELTKSVSWVDEMNEFRGRSATIIETIAPGIVKLSVDNGLFFWSTRWLTRKLNTKTAL